MRRMLMTTILVLLTFLLTLSLAQTARADGVLIPGQWPRPARIMPPEPPPPSFTIKYHHVDVTIEGQIARTHVDQVFKSEYHREMEATYLFPIPEDAVIQDFSLWIGNEKVSGKVLDAKEARKIYEDIVRRRKDPGLLEYAGRGLFRARVYPVPAHGEMRIELEYTELLPQEFHTVRYRYPLDTERFSAKPIESVRILVEIHSQTPIRNVYSPSHNISVRHSDDHSVTVSYEENHTRPDKDLTLYYTLSREEVGLGLLTFTPPEEDGYFLLLASPRAEVQEKEIAAKDIVFVFDRTGSMSGEKIEQAREALKFCLGTLNPQDRFNLIPFNENPDLLFPTLVPADKENLDRALDLARSLDASGGTNIDQALTTALPLFEQAERPSYVLFLTDGLPTVGVKDVGRILEDVSAAAPAHVRIFAFGVGYDVNTTLLDQLALQQRGATEYVRPGEDIEVKVSNLFRMISFPVLTDLALDFGGMRAYDIYPDQLPDLFKGSQLVVTGRFRGKGKAEITLTGSAEGRRHSFDLSQPLDLSATHDELVPLIWAQRKIGFLLAEIRSQGRNPELVTEIVRLSKKFGIITEYTSFLVEEPGIVTHRDFEERAGRLLDQNTADAMAHDSGSWSVNQSVNLAGSQKAAKAPSSVQKYYGKSGQEVTVSTVRNVKNRAFFQHDNQWVDHNYTEDQPVLKIKSFSKAQFQLLERDPSLGNFMALGEEVLFLVNGRAVQIGPDGIEELSEAQITALFG